MLLKPSVKFADPLIIPYLAQKKHFENKQLEALATFLLPKGLTARTALDFESVASVTYQHLPGSIAQNQRIFLPRVASLCPVCAVGLGTACVCQGPAFIKRKEVYA